MSRLAIEVGLGQVGRGHALVARPELHFLGQLLEFLPNDGAVRQPQGQPAPHHVVDMEDVEFAAELLVVALERQFVGRDMGIELRLVGERPCVDARHHDVVGVAAPVGAGDAAQLERVARNVAGRVHVGSLAHVEERTVSVEGQAIEVAAGEKLFGVFALVWLAHLVDAFEGFVGVEFLAVEPLTGSQDPLHAPLDFREVLLVQRLGQDEVVVEAVRDGGPEAERRVRPHVQNSLRQHMREAVPNPVEVVVSVSAVFQLHFRLPSITTGAFVLRADYGTTVPGRRRSPEAHVPWKISRWRPPAGVLAPAASEPPHPDTYITRIRRPDWHST